MHLVEGDEEARREAGEDGGDGGGPRRGTDSKDGLRYGAVGIWIVAWIQPRKILSGGVIKHVHNQTLSNPGK